MKIIFLEAVQSYGGARKSTVELAARLKAVGHEVLIVDFWGCCDEFLRAIEEYGLRVKVLDSRKEPFVLSSKNRLNYFKNIIQYYFLQKRYKTAFSKIAKDFLADIVCVNNLKCLNVLESRSTYSIDYFARGWFSYKDLSWFSKRKFKKYAPRFLTVSQSTRQAIYTGGIAQLKDITVLTDVVNSEMLCANFSPIMIRPNEMPIKILHSGGFLMTKGQHICLEIAKELTKENVSFEMTLTGIIYKGESSKKYYDSIIQAIKKDNLEDKVTVVLNPPNILDYFQNTDILIHPSWTEGLPRVCLEALAFGKPIIANPAGGVTDVVIHNLTGFITDFNSIPQYVKYIKKYIKDPLLYEKHSEMGKKLIECNYLDKNQVERINEIYP